MIKFLEWFGRYRQTIGYTVGGLNVLNGILNILAGNIAGGIFWLVLGSAIILDAKVFK
jgi:hypothetical protein